MSLTVERSFYEFNRSVQQYLDVQTVVLTEAAALPVIAITPEIA